MQRNLLDGLEFFHEYRDQRKANAFPPNSFSPTHQGISTMATQNQQKEKTSKEQYQELISVYKDQSPQAKNVAEAVLGSLLITQTNPAFSSILTELEEASRAGNIPLVAELLTKFNDINRNESSHKSTIDAVRKQVDWEKVRRAFQPELEALAYDAALEALKAAHQAVHSVRGESKGKRQSKPKAEGESTRAPAAKKVYKITGPDNLNITMEVGQGPKAWSDDEAMILEALGIKFTRNEKDKIIVDGDQNLPDGSKLSRGNLGAALVAKAFEDKGFSATLS